MSRNNVELLNPKKNKNLERFNDSVGKLATVFKKGWASTRELTDQEFEAAWQLYFTDESKLPQENKSLRDQYLEVLKDVFNAETYSPKGIQKILEQADFVNPKLLKRTEGVLYDVSNTCKKVEDDWWILSDNIRNNFIKSRKVVKNLMNKPENNYYLSSIIKKIYYELEIKDGEAQDAIEKRRKEEQEISLPGVVLVQRGQYLMDINQDPHNNPNFLLSEKNTTQQDFTIPLVDQLTKGKPDRSSKKNTEKVEEYVKFMAGDIRYIVERDFGVSLLDLSIPEQYQFLKFIESKTNASIGPVKAAVCIMGSQILRSFLSLEQDRSLGDKIIELGNRLPEDVAKKIFSKYAELVDLTDSVAGYVQQFQKNNKESRASENKEGSIQQVSEKLLIRAKDVLVYSMDKSPEEILKMLDAVKADAELFKSTFSIEKKKGNNISLENIREAQFENKKSNELVEEEKDAMRDLYRKNYASNPPFQKVLLESFENALKNPQTTFYLFKLKGEIKGFDRFDDWGDGRKYFGSFNVDESMQGATLGESMIDQSVNVEAKAATIIADCSAVNRIGARYIENGFVATSFTENYYGVPAFSIVRNDREISPLIKSKQMSEEDLLKIQQSGRKDLVVKTAQNQEALIEMFKQVGHGYLLTRYFQDESSKQWVVVLEQVKQEVV